MALRGGGGNEAVCNRLTGNFSLGTSSTLSILPVDLTKCLLHTRVDSFNGKFVLLILLLLLLLLLLFMTLQHR